MSNSVQFLQQCCFLAPDVIVKMREMLYFGNRDVDCMDTTSKQGKENKA